MSRRASRRCPPVPEVRCAPVQGHELPDLSVRRLIHRPESRALRPRLADFGRPRPPCRARNHHITAEDRGLAAFIGRVWSAVAASRPPASGYGAEARWPARDSWRAGPIRRRRGGCSRIVATEGLESVLHEIQPAAPHAMIDVHWPRAAVDAWRGETRSARRYDRAGARHAPRATVRGCGQFARSSAARSLGKPRLDGHRCRREHRLQHDRAAQRAGPRGRVVALEPTPDTWQCCGTTSPPPG